jgi:ribosomal protein S18 acetylase RimI-like enzyme
VKSSLKLINKRLTRILGHGVTERPFQECLYFIQIKISFNNINTTLGFVRYNEEAEVEYIFVNPMFRRQGLAKKLLSIVEEKMKIKPTPQDPISPLGEKLFKVSKQDIN